jgi:hypothetical protein
MGKRAGNGASQKKLQTSPGLSLIGRAIAFKKNRQQLVIFKRRYFE